MNATAAPALHASATRTRAISTPDLPPDVSKIFTVTAVRGKKVQ
jgi:hypothetical protein